MGDRPECAVVGCSSQRVWRQMCKKHARRLLNGEPLADPPKVVGRELVCPMCSKTWRRMSGQARYCSNECRRLAHQAYAPMAENPTRDAAIVAAVAAGELRRVIAARWGLSEGRIWQIVHRGSVNAD